MTINPALFQRLHSNDTTLTVLDFTFQAISDDDLRLLSEALKANTTVTRLKLNRCGITNRGAQMLAAVLGENTTLKDIRLSENEIGNLGAMALSAALYNQATLTYLDLSENKIGATGLQALRSRLTPGSALRIAMEDQNNDFFANLGLFAPAVEADQIIPGIVSSPIRMLK